MLIVKKVTFIIIVSLTMNYFLFTQETTPQTNPVFNADTAMERSNEMVKEHWENYHKGVSRYYGRVWLDNYAKGYYIGDSTYHDDYIQELRKRDMQKVRMDCTIYCAKVLKAGMGSEEYSKLVNYHNAIWSGYGFAGWSVGHLLVDRFGWKAYAFIESGANYHHHYISHFKDKKEYPVWKQPNIKIEAYYSLGEDDAEIEKLLSQHKFSWGFSKDGIHTWITNYANLLECHWDGTPAAKYNVNNWFPDLFETTRFIEYKDYNVHIIVVPPENN